MHRSQLTQDIKIPVGHFNLINREVVSPALAHGALRTKLKL